MPEKRKPTGLSAFTEAAARPAAPAPRAAADAPTRQRSRRAAPAQGERVNLTYRVTPASWERVRHLALSDRVSVQELLHTALSREFARRGLPPLDD
jgi:hypothetical protein